MIKEYNSKKIESAMEYAESEFVRTDKSMAVVTLTGQLFHVMDVSSAKNLGIAIVGVVSEVMGLVQQIKDADQNKRKENCH